MGGEGSGREKGPALKHINTHPPVPSSSPHHFYTHLPLMPSRTIQAPTTPAAVDPDSWSSLAAFISFLYCWSWDPCSTAPSRPPASQTGPVLEHYREWSAADAIIS